MELDIFRLDDGAFAERTNRRADAEMQIPERAGELGNGGLAGGLRGFIFEEEEEVNIRTGEKHAAAITAGCRDASFRDRKSTRLNSSHGYISYAVFCLKKKKKKKYMCL